VDRQMHRLVSALMLAPLLAACGGDSRGGQHDPAVMADVEFAELQERGRIAMGVDQYTSTHLFDALPDGGRIELQRDTDDPAGIAVIRQHLRDISLLFAAGDFRIPGYVHARPVPGTEVMARKRNRITYRYADLPRGGEVRLVTADPEAIQAIHAFMEFQRMDHRADGHDHAGAHSH
jgi:hypothetical protein